MGGLEGGRSLAFSSGMAAVACIFHGLPVGSVLVIPEDPYHAVNGLAIEGEQQGSWTVQRLDLADTTAWVTAGQDADLLWLESPANPLMTVADLPAICSAPAQAGLSGRRRQHVRDPTRATSARLRRRHRDALGHQVHRWPLRPAGRCAHDHAMMHSTTTCTDGGCATAARSVGSRRSWRSVAPAR